MESFTWSPNGKILAVQLFTTSVDIDSGRTEDQRALLFVDDNGRELRPAGKALGVTLGGVLLHQRGKLRAREVLEQLIEQACDLYDEIALLWAACGEAPAKGTARQRQL